MDGNGTPVSFCDDTPRNNQVSNSYDAQNQWIKRVVDTNGTTSGGIEQTIFVYQNGQIVLQFDKSGTGDLDYEDLSHRYLWGPAVDMLLADEQIDWSDTYADGEVLWALPKWKKGTLPSLTIPATMQKKNTEESIPLLPWLEELLLETPKSQRFGWCFNPVSLQFRLGRRARHQRPSAEWVSKIISRIGEKSGVIVQPAKGDGKPKFASAHDLRRSCAERLASAGVPEREIAKVLRHADVETTRKFYAPGTVQDSAGIIRSKITVPRNSQPAEST